MKEVVIVSAVRTPMTKFRGEFADLSAPLLGSYPLKAAVERVGLPPEKVDEVIFGNLFGSDWANPARQCVFLAGFPDSVPALTVDRQCSSSLNALALAASMIQTGMTDIVAAGGVESYSQQPFYVEKPSVAYPMALRFTEYKTSIKGDHMPMILTAEKLAEQYGITREECDAFAVESHQKAAAAWANGYFDEQVVPVTVPQRKGEPLVVSRDTGVRADISMESLGRLRPVMKADGVVTAGNASPMNDGASALLIMRREKAEELGLAPLAVVKEYASAGCDPTIMGIGPVYSTRKLMERFGYTLDDFDLIELNEAFAAQSLACVKEMGLDMAKVNVEGGAIAIGHPNGASGGMLAARMAYALRRRGLKRGLVTFCCGGGQGFSLVLENPDA